MNLRPPSLAELARKGRVLERGEDAAPAMPNYTWSSPESPCGCGGGCGGGCEDACGGALCGCGSLGGGSKAADSTSFKRAGRYDAASAALPMAAFGAGADRDSPFGEPIYVDVYLSAGPTTDEYSCDTHQDSNCSIYRLRVNLTAMRVVEVERVVSGGRPLQGDRWGAVQPALSPSGGRLAYIYRNDTTSRLEARGAGGARPDSVDIGTGDDRPQFPNWYTEDTLLYHKGSEGGRSLYAAEVDGTSPLSFASPRARLGAKAGVATDTSFADAATRRGSVEAGRNVVTFGASTRTGEAPRVHSLSAGAYGTLATQEFDLGENLLGNSIAECHHPAWNVSGDEILCTAYRSESGRVETYPNDETGKPTRMLYSYSRSSRKWSQVADKTTFTPLTPDELAAGFGALFRTSDCHLYTYKFAEWCGTDDFVVATLYCTKERTEEMVSSRVMLIRRSPVRYLDLTGAIEAWGGDASGTFRGVYSTCSAPEKSR